MKTQCCVFSQPLYEAELKVGSGIRLDVGGRPGNPVLMPTLIQSLRLIRETGIHKMHAYCKLLHERFIDSVSSLDMENVDLLMPVKTSPHIFGLKVRRKKDGEDLTEELYNYLKSGGEDGTVVHVSNRSGHVRVGFYGYNTESEVDLFVAKVVAFTRLASNSFKST